MRGVVEKQTDILCGMKGLTNKKCWDIGKTVRKEMKMKKVMKRTVRSIAGLLAIVLLLGMIPFSVSAASFSPRLTAPSRSGYYSNNTNTNPYSVNTQKGNGNCTWYAWGRAYEILGSRPKINTIGNACTWYTNNKNSGNYAYGSTPKLGAIACWSGGAGHVAVVEQINSDGTITISESSWSASNWWFRTRRINSNGSLSGLTFQGFIYLINSKTVPAAAKAALKKISMKSYAVSFRMKSASYTNAYSAPNGSYVGRVYPGDVVTVKKVYTSPSGWVEMICPWSENGRSYNRTIYVRLSEFKFEATRYIQAYDPSTGNKVGRVYPSDVCFGLEMREGSVVRCFCPWSGGYNREILVRGSEILG